jgi:hypothetical protein
MKQPRAIEAPRIVVPSRAVYGKFVRIITTEVLEQVSGVAPEGLRLFRADEGGKGFGLIGRPVVHVCPALTVMRHDLL